ncbi:MAG: RHS repeat protein [Halanaerobiales bacterium]|nr:RHS repeat protein [Halanaerobiales bacterium]
MYDALGRLIKVKDAEGGAVLSFYDRKGQTVKVMAKVEEGVEGDQNNTNIIDGVLYQVQKKVYHPIGWVTAEIIQAGDESFINYHQYDLIGKEITVTDARGIVEIAAADASWKKFL